MCCQSLLPQPPGASAHGALVPTPQVPVKVCCMLRYQGLWCALAHLIILVHLLLWQSINWFFWKKHVQLGNFVTEFHFSRARGHYKMFVTWKKTNTIRLPFYVKSKTWEWINKHNKTDTDTSILRTSWWLPERRGWGTELGEAENHWHQWIVSGNQREEWLEWLYWE